MTEKWFGIMLAVFGAAGWCKVMFFPSSTASLAWEAFGAGVALCAGVYMWRRGVREERADGA